MTEELESELDPVKKHMLMQKYGLVEPKLTLEEQAWITKEYFDSGQAYKDGWRQI